ncbi:MAG: SEC-C domain-containing protein [Clostridia bacterium]|nr:SEC-C domain-containing protein [Clostridia bacterium]
MQKSKFVFPILRSEAQKPKPPVRIIPVKKEGVISRNDPCPCGSGKKYKFCCGKDPEQ